MNEVRITITGEPVPHYVLDRIKTFVGSIANHGVEVSVEPDVDGQLNPVHLLHQDFENLRPKSTLPTRAWNSILRASVGWAGSEESRLNELSEMIERSNDPDKGQKNIPLAVIQEIVGSQGTDYEISLPYSGEKSRQFLREVLEAYQKDPGKQQ